MRDLRFDLTNLWRAAARITSPEGGRALMFVSARSGEGSSSIATSFALMAASRSSRSTWLIDLDFRRNPLFKAFDEGFSKNVGRPGRAYDASLNVTPIYALSPPGPDRAEGSKLLTVHQIEGTRLLVTRFRNERLRQGQRVQLKTQPKWWSALRASTDWIIVDAPALERSAAGLAMASQMDGVVLVVRADKTSVEEVTAMRLEIEGHGGKVVGVVMNRVRADARLADRLSG